MSARAWSAFWATSAHAGCLPNAPALLARLGEVWAGFARELPDGAVLDIASGNGSVIRALRTIAPRLQLAGVDYAEVGAPAAALGIRGGVDAAQLPFADAALDGVTSQFGIEYCPPDALAEAARVMRPGGFLRLVCHHADSAAIVHNAARLAAMRALDAAGLFTMAADIATGRGEDATRAGAIARARQQHAAQSICEELPVALGQALGRPDPRRGVAAITAMASAETVRLGAMVAAALDDQGVAVMLARLEAAGVKAQGEPLAVAGEAPFAWLVSGRRV